MNVAEVMTPVVIAARPDTPLAQAVRLMIENRISGMPVLDEAGRPVGILTEGDLLRRSELDTAGGSPGWLRAFLWPGQLAGNYVRTHARRVSDVMTSDVISAQEAMPLEEVIELMRRHRVRRLPVTRDGIVIGIISRADLLRALARKLDKPAATSSDSAIREAIFGELARQPWFPRRAVTIAVENGVVNIDGVVFDVRERDAIRVAAENAPGIKCVENRLVCVEPYTGMLIIDPMDEAAEAEARDKLPL